MSLRIIIKPQLIQQWIADRQGTPARKRGTDTELCIQFGDVQDPYEPLPFDELIETMRFHRLSLLVDQEPGKTEHKFIQHS